MHCVHLRVESNRAQSTQPTTRSQRRPSLARNAAGTTSWGPSLYDGLSGYHPPTHRLHPSSRPPGAQHLGLGERWAMDQQVARARCDEVTWLILLATCAGVQKLAGLLQQLKHPRLYTLLISCILNIFSQVLSSCFNRKGTSDVIVL